MTMNQSRTTHFCRTAVFTLFAMSLPVGLRAEQAPVLAKLDQPLMFNLSEKTLPALDLTEDGVAYSSSTGSGELAAAENYVTSSAATQPPPRRRYGRPNYSDKMHNADGSSKIAIVLGGGFTAPVFDPSTKYLKTSWKIQTGVGYNFNKKFGIIAQFDYDNFALPGSLIASQQAVYNAQNFTYSDGTAVDFSGLDGHTHDWSLTLNPTYNFYQGEKGGAYAVVGGGFYHKVTNFTLPQTGQYCDPYYGVCYTYQANQTFDLYTSNSAGVNGGIGFTYKPSRFASERLYAEARYVFNFNNQRAGTPVNLYPGNSATTSYVPVTVGIRF